MQGDRIMTIASILKHKGHEIASVSPVARVPEIVKTLADRRIGAVLVRDSARQLLGIVSERDIVRSLARDGAAALDMTAAQLMTRALHTVTPHTTVAEAMSRMTESRVRHLPVLEDGELVGLISIGDVVKTRLEQQEQEVDSLRAYVSGSV
jgi:CBS domain-containing protein